MIKLKQISRIRAHTSSSKLLTNTTLPLCLIKPPDAPCWLGPNPRPCKFATVKKRLHFRIELIHKKNILREKEIVQNEVSINESSTDKLNILKNFKNNPDHYSKLINFNSNISLTALL